ncbi:MAG: response regulator [Candidatus Obscuribacterales bacterium]|nr:response regulator [Candidatus Obscuribacterales bacterium]
MVLLEQIKNSQQVVESLTLSGHKVVAVKDFKQAISFLQSNSVDLIISDVHLENGGNVFDFLKWVRRNPSICDLPFVLFSSKPSPIAKYIEDGVRTAARIFGATSYITMETFDADELCRQIDSLLTEANRAASLAQKENSE